MNHPSADDTQDRVQHEHGPSHSFVSLVIPIRNEGRFVGRCLESLLGQIGTRREFEILCIDGMSTDETRTIVMGYVKKDPRVRLIDNPRTITPVALNLGVKAARGDVIMIVGCHTEYAPDYIDKCLEVLHRTGADQVGPYLITKPGEDAPVGRAIAAATSSAFGVGGGFRVPGPEREVGTLAFGALRRDVYDRYGMYDERLVRNQDVELCTRITAGGGRVIVSPLIKAVYFNRSKFAGLRQQAFRNGQWNPYTVYLCGGGLLLRHFVPLAFVLSLIVLSALGFVWPVAWIALAAVSLVYLAVGLVMARKASDGSSISPGLVLLAFIQLHLSYGIGSLWGVITAPFKFGIRRRHVQLGALPDRKD